MFSPEPLVARPGGLGQFETFGFVRPRVSRYRSPVARMLSERHLDPHLSTVRGRDLGTRVLRNRPHRPQALAHDA